MDATRTGSPPLLTRWQSTWRYLFASVTGAVFWVTSYYGTYAGEFRLLWSLDLLLGVVGVILMRWRRRRPLVVALVVNSLGSFSTAVSGAVIVTTLSLATRRRWREIVPVAAVGFLASVVFFQTHPGAENSWLFSLLFTIVFVSGVIAPGMYVGARRDLLATLQERAERAEGEQRLRVGQAKLTERARIAREMHDALAHRLSLVALHAGALEYCKGLSYAEIAAAAAITRRNAHLALDDLHEILGVLRSVETNTAPERPQPTLVDLSALIQETLGAGTNVRLHNHVDGLAGAPDTIGRSAYRMIQESLTNARKHAPDTTVDVTLSGRPGGQLTLEVRNPLRVGAPVNATPGSGLGLLGLTERAELIGGRFEHLTSDGNFVVRAWLPWPA